MTNGRVAVVFSAVGEIVSLTVDGAPVALAEPGGQLWLYPDHPHDYAAWEVDHEALRIGQRAVDGKKVATSGHGTAAGSITFARPFPKGGGMARITYQLRATESWVRVTCEVELQQPQALLRWVFPTKYQGATARFGAPFGSVLRPQLPGRPGDEAYWESPASRWAVVADDGEQDGLFVVTEAKYGFEAFEGRLAVTLLRSAYQTGEQGGLARSAPSALRVSGRKAFPDLGTHSIELAFGRFHPAAPRRELPASLADTLFTRPVAYRGTPRSSGYVDLQGAESLVPAWARPLSSDRWLLRLHETLGRRGHGKIILAPGYELETVGVRDAVGEPVAPEISFGPYQILSFVICQRTALRRSRG
jgi:alpha-mannosidase